jgi:hypothetical protein
VTISYFDCHRCFLPLDHEFRLDSDTFKKGNIILEGPPGRLSGAEIAEMLDNLVLNKEGNGFVGYGNDHNLTHKCALWELLYAKALILMHNIDVMHQEYNVGENILSTCMSFADKIKDNHKARKDLALICNRPSLELKSRDGKPRAPFCLKARDKKEVILFESQRQKRSIDLVKKLKFSYGYATGFRRAVNLDTGKLSGVKSHDYHIFMKRLIHVMFRGYLDDEAKIGGPQQYRWIYHTERALKKLRAMVHNKTKVEGCITEEFKLKEMTYFSSVHFAEHHNINAPTFQYHVDEDIPYSAI